MFCNKCGAQIEEGKLFCTGCGMAVGGEVAPSLLTKLLKYKKLIISVPAVIAVIVGICFAANFIGGQKKQEENLVDTANTAAGIWLESCANGNFDKAMEVCAHSSDTNAYSEFEERTEGFIEWCASYDNIRYKITEVELCDEDEVEAINENNVYLKNEVTKASDVNYTFSFNGEEIHQDLRVVKIGDEWYVL